MSRQKNTRTIAMPANGRLTAVARRQLAIARVCRARRPTVKEPPPSAGGRERAADRGADSRSASPDGAEDAKEDASLGERNEVGQDDAALGALGKRSTVSAPYKPRDGVAH